MRQTLFSQGPRQEPQNQFSELLVVQKDIKDSFRRLLRKEDAFNKAIAASHTRFFNKLYK